jgi:hypothetical protein
MNIGEFEREVVIEPLEVPAPVKEPEREPEKVPA